MSEPSRTESSNRSSERIAPKIRQRKGPQYRTGGEIPQDLSEAIRETRSHTEGLGNRLPLSSIEAMRAGTVAGPHTLIRRYLMAGRLIGQPKEWAQKYATWVQRQVDCLWPMEQTPTATLEIKAMEVEARDDLAEKRLTLARTRETLQTRIDCLQAELAADSILLARYDRELEGL